MKLEDNTISNELSLTYHQIIRQLKTNHNDLNSEALFLQYQTSFGDIVKINDESSLLRAFEEIFNRKFTEKTNIIFYYATENSNIPNQGKPEKKDLCDVAISRSSNINKQKTLYNLSDTPKLKEKINKTNRIKHRLKLKKKFKKTKFIKKGPFMITKTNCIPKKIDRRDFKQGQEKYLITNLDRYKRKIPPLVKTKDLADLITEWFFLSKDVIKTSLAAANKTLIRTMTAFIDYNLNISLRLRFQFNYKDNRYRMRRRNKSFSFYQSGVDKSWTTQEGKKRMSNFLEFATRNIEIINGPISLRDF